MSERVAITIGNFDGVHLGHVELVRRARIAVGTEGHVVVLSFDPHPLSRLRPDAVPARLTSFGRRCELLRAAGADEVVPLEPSAALLAQSPECFVESVVQRFRPSFVLEGPDFRFGRGRSGSISTLRALGPRHGFETVVVDAVSVALTDHQLVTAGSSIARWLVARGRMDDATAVLGHPHELTSTVVRGEQRGRELGMPTANLDATAVLLPADGVYAGRARGLDGGPDDWHPAAISVGTNPTFDGDGRRCEAHLLGWDGALDDYGWTVRLEIGTWLRDQICFDDVGLLVAQMHRDVRRAAGPARIVASRIGAGDCV